ncbi:MAG: AAA family ATPase [Spirochaetales bacterium]|nr:MAG: AAA family ATPase [Spirochaetales bacterium]
MEKQELTRNIDRLLASLETVTSELRKRIIGQDELIRGILTALIAGGHVLIEGLPGLAKTLTVKSLAAIIRADFKRIQFTPDLLPADLVGTMIYRQDRGEFFARKGPVFSNIILADEINRAPAKVQSALLEAMEERQVTLGETTYPLPGPFHVFATQNPIEQEGTYPLPEAQVDRFLLKLHVPYPSTEEELAILDRFGFSSLPEVEKTAEPSLFVNLAEAASAVAMEEHLKGYVVSLVESTRPRGRNGKPYAKYIRYGASPRASLSLYTCAKIEALFNGRTHVLPDDIKRMALPVMRHRILLSYEAEAIEKSADDVLLELLDTIPIP